MKPTTARSCARPDIDLIDISTPGNTHVEIALEAAKNGKMIICEKPLANDVAQAELMLNAVREYNVPNAVCFNYRRIPAIAQVKKMLEDGRLGKIYHFRGIYLQGLDRRSSDAAGLAPAERNSRFGLAWRSQRPPDRYRLLPSRPDRRGVRNARHVHHRAGPCWRNRTTRLGGKASDQKGPVTGRRLFDFFGPASRAARSEPSRPPRMAAGRKNHSGFEINGEKRLGGLQHGADERARNTTMSDDPRRHPWLPSHTNDIGSPPVHRQLLADRPHYRLRTHVHQLHARHPRRLRRPAARATPTSTRAFRCRKFSTLSTAARRPRSWQVV